MTEPERLRADAAGEVAIRLSGARRVTADRCGNFRRAGFQRPFRNGAAALWRNFRVEDLATPEALRATSRSSPIGIACACALCYRRARIPDMPALAEIEQLPYGAQGRVHVGNTKCRRTARRARSQNIVELHGGIRTWRCVGCAREQSIGSADLMGEVDVDGLGGADLSGEADGDRLCGADLFGRPADECRRLLHCSCGSLLRPGVVWFGGAASTPALGIEPNVPRPRPKSSSSPVQAPRYIQPQDWSQWQSVRVHLSSRINPETTGATATCAIFRSARPAANSCQWSSNECSADLYGRHLLHRSPMGQAMPALIRNGQALLAIIQVGWPTIKVGPTEQVSTASVAVSTCDALTLLAVFAMLVQPRESPTPPSTADMVIAAAGDIACDPAGTIDRTLGTVLGWCRMGDTEKLIEERRVDAVLALGDEQYQSATTDGFAHGYDLTWGKVKAITYPTPGNHEYYTPGAAGYFAYFGARAGDAATGYYSFNLGSWHIISLNGNCDEVGGCDAGSAQERWLHDDLARETSACALAFFGTSLVFLQAVTIRMSATRRFGMKASMQPAPTSCSPDTITTTNASLRRRRLAPLTRRTGSESSSWGPAAKATISSVGLPRTAKCAIGRPTAFCS